MRQGRPVLKSIPQGPAPLKWNNVPHLPLWQDTVPPNSTTANDGPRLSWQPQERSYFSGSAVVDLISSIDKSAVTLCTRTSEISAW